VHINGLQTNLVPVCVLLAVCSQTVYKQMFLFLISCGKWKTRFSSQTHHQSAVHYSWGKC